MTFSVKILERRGFWVTEKWKVSLPFWHSSCVWWTDDENAGAYTVLCKAQLELHSSTTQTCIVLKSQNYHACHLISIFETKIWDTSARQPKIDDVLAFLFHECFVCLDRKHHVITFSNTHFHTASIKDERWRKWSSYLPLLETQITVR